MSDEIRSLTLNEINALLNSITDSRDRAIVILFLNTGIFLNELINLKTDSINHEKKVLNVRSSRKRELLLNDQKLVSKFDLTEPKATKPVSEIKGPIIINPEETVIGRGTIIEEAKSNWPVSAWRLLEVRDLCCLK